MKLFKLIFKNLTRNKRRTILTVLSIGIAIFLFCTLKTLNASFKAGVESADVSRLVVRSSTSLIFPLPISYKQKLEGMPGIEKVTHMSWFGGVYIDEKNFFPRFAVEGESFLSVYPEYTLSDKEKEDFFKDRQGCIIGRKTAERFGLKAGDKMVMKGDIYMGSWEFFIRGIYRGINEAADETLMFFHWKYLDEGVIEPMKGQVGTFIVKIKDVQAASQISEMIDKEFANSPYETRTETEKAFQGGFVKMMGNIKLLIIIVGSAVVISILMIAANTMSMTVRERRREIGILKAVGFSTSNLFFIIIVEILIIALSGGMIGSISAKYSLKDFTGGGIFPFFIVAWSTVTAGLFIAMIIGIISGVFPAYHASRLPVTEALRKVD